jgi:hypothetical protein
MTAAFAGRSVAASERKEQGMSGRECAMIATAAAGVAAALAFRAGQLAAKAELRQAHETSRSEGAAGAPPAGPTPHARHEEVGSDFAEWEQAALPRDS